MKIEWRAMVRVAVGWVLLGVLLCAVSARGGTLLFPLDNAFSGTSPSGPGPWVDAWLTDVSPGTVMLSISNVAITSSEKVSELYLNLNPTLSPTSLHFTFQQGSSGVTAPLPSLGVNSFKADGDGKYDILFQFSEPPTTAFGANDFLTYKITGITGLTADDFAFLSYPDGGHGPFYAAIHVQGINATSVTDGSSSSGWVSPSQIIDVVSVPEPSSSALFLMAGVVGIAARRHLKRGSAA